MKEQNKPETVEAASESLYPVNYKNMFEGMNIGKIQRDAFVKGTQWQQAKSTQLYTAKDCAKMLEALRQRCAEEARVDCSDFDNYKVDKDSILDVEYKDLIK